MGPNPDRALTPQEFVQECFDFKREHAPKAQFMPRLIAGKCSKAELHRWVKDAYYYTAAATPNIAAWLALAPTVPDRSIFRAIARNLAGELGYIKEAAHVDLYEQLLDGMGISLEEAHAHLPLPSTLGAAAAVGFFCRSSFEEGLGAFGLAVEMQVPGRPVGADVIYNALRKNYDLDDRTLEFYAVHVEAEEEHGENAMTAVEWLAPPSSRRGCGARSAGACSRTPGWPKGTTRCSIGEIGDRRALRRLLLAGPPSLVPATACLREIAPNPWRR
jgi:pyrroloquinoline quinone (PQQ) biosynthesis protein C